MTQSKSRKFSIIIPTRDRSDTLRHSLKTVTAQGYDCLEIIVSDNASEDNTRAVVEQADDNRIRYINTGARVSMSENWEFALSHVTGDWLTIIGDDDAILPKCFETVNTIVAVTGVQAVRSAVCSYTWPHEDGSSGRLSVPMQTGFEVRNSKKWLNSVLLGKAEYSTLPMLYNGGFVSMEVIRSAMRQDRFYRSCIPDVYSAIVFSNLLSKYAYCFQPLAINGASKHSTGTSKFSKSTSDKRPVQKFLSEGNIPFHSSVPMTDLGEFPKSLQAFLYESCERFAEIVPTCVRIPPNMQLRTILATAGSRRNEIDPWAKKFAAQHQLDYDSIARIANRDSQRHRFWKLVSRLKTCADVDFTSEMHAIADAYQASVVADATLQSKSFLPSRIVRRIASKITRVAS